LKEVWGGGDGICGAVVGASWSEILLLGRELGRSMRFLSELGRSMRFLRELGRSMRFLLASPAATAGPSLP
jgi:hypothetical protein